MARGIIIETHNNRPQRRDFDFRREEVQDLRETIGLVPLCERRIPAKGTE